MPSLFERRTIEWVVFIAAVAGVIYLLRALLTPIMLAVAVSYIIAPIVNRLEKWRISRGLSVLLIMGLIFMFALAIFLWAVPATAKEAIKLAERLPSYFDTVKIWLEPTLEEIRERHPKAFDATFENAKVFIKDNAPKIVTGPALGYIKTLFSNMWNFVIGVLGLFLIPIFVFYFTRDSERLRRALWEYAPKSYEEYLKTRLREINAIISHYVRRALVVAVILAILYSTGLTLLGVPGGFIIGIISGFANLVPYLGWIVGFFPAAVFSLLEYQSLWYLLYLLLLYGAVQGLESSVLTPNIVGAHVGLHPVIVIVGVLIGGQLFGFLGILLAIPAMASATVFIPDLKARLKTM